ncbi:DNA-binding protein [Actinorhabdospora filicis]|uniref:DNA-binding protein n=1 Tax=Actinorhabdospora filicis TaxID=1785913 RepID=A0A9W6SGD3_9ACTN|nr:SCO2523 family variant P-loop protein [Actinorhabdospora filicis]GLZ75813.1 DNA-binding protein [Actinorhabdospora filicis]
MLVFATSDKGGTGRSVTSSNIIYRRALGGHDVAYLDFDFGSPTAGAIFGLRASQGTRTGFGMHRYLRGFDGVDEPQAIDIWGETERQGLRNRPDGSGNLVLFPGDEGGGEFASNKDVVARCVRLFTRLEEEFSMVLVDLSAGRSYATHIVLQALADRRLSKVMSRWLVFHRWTRQHVLAASNLVYGKDGLLESGEQHKLGADQFLQMIRFVRTAVVDPRSTDLSALRPTQLAWLTDTNKELQKLASELRLGRTSTLGSVPLDPVLQWREQIITDTDTITRQIANPATVDSFVNLGKKLADDWSEL